MSEIVRTEVEAGLGRVIMTRPPMNALSLDMAKAINLAMQRFAYDDTIRAVLLCTDGPYFMAGGDIAYISEVGAKTDPVDSIFATRELIQEAHSTVRTIRSMPKPVIASVKGGAAGIGVSLVAACDLAIAADNSVYALAYSALGTTPDGGATFMLPRLMGLKQAAELILLSDRFDAQRALQLGLLNQLVPADQLAAETEKLAKRLASGPTVVYAKAKELLNASLTNSFDQQLEMEERAFAACSRTEDFAEGVTAFSNKRKPNFSGK